MKEHNRSTVRRGSGFIAVVLMLVMVFSTGQAVWAEEPGQAAVQTAQNPQPTDWWQCPECGLWESGNFCTNCGHARADGEMEKVPQGPSGGTGSMQPNSPAQNPGEAAIDLNSYQPNEIDQPYLTMAEERKDAIRSTATDIVPDITGTIYYVSNSGDDQNDGLSPDTAWASLSRAEEQMYEPGDCLLLERGSEWVRAAGDEFSFGSDAFLVPDGLTVGAYGEGPKPVIRGDIPEEANDPDFWTLYDERDGARIWQAARPLSDVNVIVLNDGTEWADKVMPCHDGNNYYDQNSYPFDVTAGLYKDLTFCCLLDLEGQLNDIGDRGCKGELYLRCDAGNPAEVYESVCVPQCRAGIRMLSHTALYDIDLRYFPGGGILMADTMYEWEGFKSVVNCEVSWCGGLISSYFEQMGAYYPIGGGGAMQITSHNVRIENNYLHDNGPFTLIVSIHKFLPDQLEFHHENIHISGNLMERGGTSAHWADLSGMDDQAASGFLSDYVFEDNMVFFTGMGWVQEQIRAFERSRMQPGTYRSCVENVMGAADNENILFRGNIFYLADYALVYLRDTIFDNSREVNSGPVFEGNTYLQIRSLPVLENMTQGTRFYASDENVLSAIGDETGTVISLE